MLLARGLEVTLIDSDPARIRLTRQFGQTVYFGNGWRVDVLRAAGAESAQMLILCGSKDRMTADQIQRIKREFPSLQVLVRVSDRIELMELLKSDADFLIREVFESAVAMGREALKRIGLDASTIETIETEFRTWTKPA
nr:NAD-binding protein [Hankyongella ginsenosidimutans]